jgi:cation diffusion facilitator family transporter
MANCCEDKSCELDALRASHGRVLWIVLIINAAMFLVEGTAGLLADSTSLLADALDMLGDALVYGFSLFVLARSVRWHAGAALAKGAFMLVFGLGVLGEAIYKVFHPTMPGVITMGIVGVLALVANTVCFLLLFRHRSDNLNMSSTWLCSRNDLIANGGVLLAAAGSYLLASRWPDIVVGVIIAGLFLLSALGVLRESIRVLRAPPPTPMPLQRITPIVVNGPSRQRGRQPQ